MDNPETVIEPIVNNPVNTLDAQTLNQNVTVIGNAIEFSAAVLSRLDSDLISNTLYGQDKTTQSIKEAVAQRIKTKLQIKD